MKIDVTWNPQYHCVYIHTPSHFDIPVWQKANQQIFDLLQANPAPTHVVLNMLDTHKHPLNPLEILGNTTWLKHPNLGWTIHLTSSNLIKMLARMTIHTVTAHYKQAESYEAALGFLATVDKRIGHA